MFTGIIEETGTIQEISRGAKSSRLKIQGSLIFDDLKLGDSVAVNGVCLTVAEYTKDTFTADVMFETLKRTSIGDLTIGSRVNLERAMPANGRFGGHIVSGHIDGTGTIIEIKKDDNAILYTVRAPSDVMKYIVEKGSIAIDGISLTIARTTAESFTVSIIPHTAKSTILSEKAVGDIVNLENDVIGKYVEKLMGYANEVEPKSNLTREFLAKHGF